MRGNRFKPKKYNKTKNLGNFRLFPRLLLANVMLDKEPV